MLWICKTCRTIVHKPEPHRTATHPATGAVVQPMRKEPNELDPIECNGPYGHLLEEDVLASSILRVVRQRNTRSSP